MYQIATGGLEPDSIAYPVRRFFRDQTNLKFRLTKVDVVNIDAQEKPLGLIIRPYKRKE